MRQHGNVLKVALATTAALMVLAGCGSDSKDDSAAADDATAAEETTEVETVDEETTEAAVDPADAAFCTEAESIVMTLGAADTVDPAQFTAFLDEAVTAIAENPAPEAIAADWDGVGVSVATVLAGLEMVDTSTPEGQAAFEAVLAGADADMQSSITAVATYCGA